MSFLLIAAFGWHHYAFAIPLTLLCTFLILLILVQRGRGGGLTGALGGMGGQSAFGAKAGDIFTSITVVVAALWLMLSLATLRILGGSPIKAPSGSNVATPKTTTVGDQPALPSNPADKSSDAVPVAPSSESPAAKPADAPAEKPADKAPEKPAEPAPETKTPEKPAETKPAEEKPADKPADK